ncbi:MAG: capsule assembly Wzi family protein [Nitrospirae bacterium]|nr:capsule assembly Wzi family protein [Nitrospirota bacterium]
MLNVFAAAPLLLVLVLSPGVAWGLASNNVPLDSPVYVYLEKLSGFGLIDTDIQGLKPFSKAEAARLLLEADGNMNRVEGGAPELARDISRRLHELLPREADLLTQEDEAPAFDWNPLAGMRARYIYVDGRPRDYNRRIPDEGGEGIFGIGHIRQRSPKGTTVQAGGSEGTPLLENNEGVVYRSGHNLELRPDVEFYLTKHVSALVEPQALLRDGDADVRLNKGYVKLGGKGLELQAGRDANWFGQGYRGSTVLTSNAPNLYQVKLSSPEPLRWRWLRENVGLVKYALVFSRLEASGSGKDLRQPWFTAVKLSVKPAPNLELGFNLGRQTGGPGVKAGGGAEAVIFGGEPADGTNSVAGLEFRYRLPALRDSVVYFEFAGEDAWFWPFVESYVGGVYIPRLTADGRNDLRFEFFYGNKIEYADYQFPQGFTNGNLIMGHSQGGDTKEYFARFTHYFSARNRLAVEYIHGQRGRLGRMPPQVPESRDAARVFWNLPVKGDWDALLNYGYEDVRNFNLVSGARQKNQLLRLELSYRY